MCGVAAGATRKDTCKYFLNSSEFQGTGHLTLRYTYSPLANMLNVAECLIMGLDPVAKVLFT